MTVRSVLARLCAICVVVAATSSTPVHASNPYTQNGIFLNYGFVYNVMTDAQIQSVVNWLSARQFKTQYLNISSFNADGTLTASNFSQLAHWMAVSRVTDPTQKCVAYVSGTLTMVNTPSTWQNIANSCQTLLTTYGCDGVNLDFEPYRTTSPNYIGLFSAVRSTCGSAANISLDYTADSGYFWSGADFYAISGYFNSIMAMLYDSRSKSTAAYDSFLDTALIYEYQNLHPGCALVPIVPQYAKSSTHNPSIEDIPNACGEIWNLAQVNHTIAINDIAVWWYYGWNGTTTDSQWSTSWLNL